MSAVNSFYFILHPSVKGAIDSERTVSRICKTRIVSSKDCSVGLRGFVVDDLNHVALP